MAKQPTQTKIRRKEKKNVTNAVAHVNSSFNNTVVTITDIQGNAISWSSSGTMGFKGSRKSTPYAAQLAAEDAGKKASEHGVKTVDIQVQGPGSGRETALRALQTIGFQVNSIRDVTPIPHNGWDLRNVEEFRTTQNIITILLFTESNHDWKELERNYKTI